MSLSDLLTVLPVLILVVGGIAILLIDLAIPPEKKTTLAWLSIVTLLIAGVSIFTQWGQQQNGFYGMVRTDDYALFLNGLLVCIGILTVLLTLRYNEARGIMRGEFYPLILFSLSGMMLMGYAINLLIVFVAVELLSIPLYILCGIARPRVESEESAMKYFLMGAFASGFLVYGIALIYGATGTTSLIDILSILSGAKLYDSGLLLVGAALVLVGLGFKVAAAPFHMWTPDVYEGAPTTVTAFMATATKTAGFAAVLRVFMFGFQPLITTWQPVIAAIAVLTMLVGNVAALLQTNVKRMIAYSSIAHAGYVLVGVAAGGELGAIGVLFYLAAYAFSTLAAFSVMSAVGSGSNEDQSLTAYAGLGRQRPLLGIVMAIAMFSLIGIPPTAGFVGKYFLFGAAIASGLTWLAVVGVLMSVVSAYFYLRVVTTMFIREREVEAEDIVSNTPRSIVAALSAALVFLIGILPAPLLSLATQGVQSAVSVVK